MNRETFEKIRSHMQHMMRDAAHDQLHVYRVLHQALRIAEHHPEADREVLIAGCLLHDIGRQAQFDDPHLYHAEAGGQLACAFLRELGWAEARCLHVRDCVTTHRFRANRPPESIEAKILFDADKLDVTGALGVARSLMYEGEVGGALYTVDEALRLQDGDDPEYPDSFIKEYHYKLIRLYDRFYTPEAQRIARARKAALEQFYEALKGEIDIGDLEDLRVRCTGGQMDGKGV